MVAKHVLFRAKPLDPSWLCQSPGVFPWSWVPQSPAGSTSPGVDSSGLQDTRTPASWRGSTEAPEMGSPSTPACSGARLVPNVCQGGLHGPGGVNAVRPMPQQHLTYHHYTRSFQMPVILKLRTTWGSAFETIRFM